MQSSMSEPGLKTGTMTLTLVIRDGERSTVTAAVTRLPRPLVQLLIAVKRAGLRVIRAGLLRYVRAAPAPAAAGEDRVKVYILLVSAWGMGGTIRAAINLAGYLADRYDVEIVSTYRRNEEPYFAFDPRVKVVALDDQRKGVLPRRKQRLRKRADAASRARSTTRRTSASTTTTCGPTCSSCATCGGRGGSRSPAVPATSS